MRRSDMLNIDELKFNSHGLIPALSLIHISEPTRL